MFLLSPVKILVNKSARFVSPSSFPTTNNQNLHGKNSTKVALAFTLVTGMLLGGRSGAHGRLFVSVVDGGVCRFVLKCWLKKTFLSCVLICGWRRWYLLSRISPRVLHQLCFQRRFFLLCVGFVWLWVQCSEKRAISFGGRLVCLSI